MPVLALVVFAIMVITLIDVITRPDDKVKYIPKMVWLILVIIIPLAGAIAWWLVGREYEQSAAQQPRFRTRMNSSNEPRVPNARPASFDRRTTEQQMADLDREIEMERLRAEIAKRKAQGEAS